MLLCRCVCKVVSMRRGERPRLRRPAHALRRGASWLDAQAPRAKPAAFLPASRRSGSRSTSRRGSRAGRRRTVALRAQSAALPHRQGERGCRLLAMSSARRFRNPRSRLRRHEENVEVASERQCKIDDASCTATQCRSRTCANADLTCFSGNDQTCIHSASV